MSKFSLLRNLNVKKINFFKRGKFYMKRHYLTFTELIVIVIVFLVMIAVMILPPQGIAREKARRIACASNLKQIGVTMFMYAGDYNDVFADQCTSNNSVTVLDANAGGLNRLIFLNYLSDTAIYNCPSTTDMEANGGDTITTLKTARTCSYAYAPGMMLGTSDIYGNPDSALVADMTGFMGKCLIPKSPDNSMSARINRLFFAKTKTSSKSKSDYGNHDKYGNILFQGMHVKGYSSRSQEDWFLLNYGSTYDPAIQKGSSDSSWSLTRQYKY
jgi:Protein of unknown function (DUF1559)